MSNGQQSTNSIVYTNQDTHSETGQATGPSNGRSSAPPAAISGPDGARNDVGVPVESRALRKRATSRHTIC
ncbi:uncharacterized protein MYCGRDRAFT_104054 [Zymoseptoria tritici IPO323]|uniref:Uncharacterized protein n=1 Tax=Zymoseptoria tritici (strain CBS 115943 / IPO323) TaxID=336722 RepID=F9X8U5_ZYMTI|nr:uncharacterized protein MYCGRDRAFT_104054 [Zymoseptoria tritici IPO323]EGP87842.1 hypothetical protein MYCGRDRAFT_104054 [Zymoseptoria tritici IPO323]